MTKIEEYPLHNDYSKIFAAIDSLKVIDEQTANKLKDFLSEIKETENRIIPDLKTQACKKGEQALWKSYQSLQEEKLAILDLAHEWDYMEEMSPNLTKDIKVLVRDTIEELEDHVTIIAETQKAHIDLLEIKNSRQFGVFALIVSLIISYAAVWEFFVRDLIANISFPNGLSPDLNFVLSIVALCPIFAILIWGWRNRIVDDS
jgi:hypothetical protein